MIKKGQTMSMDAVVAVALFIVAVGLLFFITARESPVDKFINIDEESEQLSDVVSSEQNLSVSIIEGSKVDVARLEEITQLRYEILKQHYGVKSEFCLYFEDEGGNVIPINEDFTGVGSQDVLIGSEPCGGLIAGDVIICENAELLGECGTLEDYGLTAVQCCTFAEVCCSAP
jgi:hypothetical protein